MRDRLDKLLASLKQPWFWWTCGSLAAVTLIALGLSLRPGGSSPRLLHDSTTTSAPSGASGSPTTANAGTTPPTATSSTPGNPGGQIVPATHDVSLTTCAATSSSQVQVGGTIDNPTGHTQNYGIVVTVVPASGHTATALDLVRNVLPATPTAWSTTGNLVAGSTQPVTCHVNSVQRAPTT
jgi:cytoskeletal protein RodZ